uniref:Protein-serine/threonine phosphatase n=1 Tax=Ascaris lumbricoides TaxID=6252 RepID=A0A0M3HKR1_ASCLU
MEEENICLLPKEANDPLYTRNVDGSIEKLNVEEADRLITNGQVIAVAISRNLWCDVKICKCKHISGYHTSLSKLLCELQGNVWSFHWSVGTNRSWRSRTDFPAVEKIKMFFISHSSALISSFLSDEFTLLFSKKKSFFSCILPWTFI